LSIPAQFLLLPYNRMNFIRILSGEPSQKAKPRMFRVYGAIFAFIPVGIIVLCFLPGVASYLDKVGVIGLYLWWFICAGVGIFTLRLWVRFIPVAVSWALAALAWIAMIWLTFTAILGS
jgi:uncharacterized membrane protein YecN with MAPEG domain